MVEEGTWMEVLRSPRLYTPESREMGKRHRGAGGAGGQVLTRLTGRVGVKGEICLEEGCSTH